MIDLHTHTTVSDGGDSPTELVHKAAAAGLDTIAVTDHDNDAGCDEAVAEGDRAGLEVVRGVEISCDVEDLRERGFTPSARPTMHLLGYFIPQGENGLSAALAELQFHRANRNQLIVEKLNELSVPITFEEVEREAGGPGSQIGRPHFAAVLVRNGVVPDYQTAFDEYLAKGAKAYLTRKLYKPTEAIELMTAAGVVPVLAHPFTLNLSIDDLELFVEALVSAGLEGIEGYHGDLPEVEQEPYRALGEAKGLVISGGSDYHGSMRPDRGMPGGKHDVIVPDAALDQLRNASRRLKAAA
ncbi:MAG: 3,5-nucleoside bisphosphate phosphatase [Actinomycetota bacterium]|jgi:predicted metal-dependent phosphoesterase TrpH|nr:3,5-nucleoside bisphosphate phosphatase [Actinomycetota bacterium]